MKKEPALREKLTKVSQAQEQPETMEHEMQFLIGSLGRS